jgi:hypothetical protein
MFLFVCTGLPPSSAPAGVALAPGDAASLKKVIECNLISVHLYSLSEILAVIPWAQLQVDY